MKGMGLFDKISNLIASEESIQKNESDARSLSKEGHQIFLEGEAMLTSRKHDEALKKFETALEKFSSASKKNKRDAENWLRYAQCTEKIAKISMKKKEFHDAIKFYRRSIDAYQNVLKYSDDALTINAAQVSANVDNYEINKINMIIFARSNSRRQ
jgi:tetratricopeptide (TPR) repeat protein